MTFKEFSSKVEEAIKNGQQPSIQYQVSVNLWGHSKEIEYSVWLALTPESSYGKGKTPEDCIKDVKQKCSGVPIENDITITEDLPIPPIAETEVHEDIVFEGKAPVIHLVNEFGPHDFDVPQETPIGEQIDGGNEIEDDN